MKSRKKEEHTVRRLGYNVAVRRSSLTLIDTTSLVIFPTSNIQDFQDLLDLQQLS